MLSVALTNQIIAERLLINHHSVTYLDDGATLGNNIFIIPLEQCNQDIFRQI